MAPAKKDKASSLFDEDKETEDVPIGDKIQINKKYATAYQLKKQKEELRKVQFDVEDDASTGSTSSEDDDGRLLPTSLDVDILKTINALRSKDKRIYDPSARFFENHDEGEGSSSDDGDDNNDDDEDDDDDEEEEDEKDRKKKPKHYKDVVREQILKQMDGEDVEEVEESEAENDEDSVDDGKDKMMRLAYDAEQKEIRKAFLESTTANHEESDDDDSTDLIVVKKKSSTKDDKDDDEVKQQLEAEIEKMRSLSSKDSAKLVDPRGEVEDGEKFLLDFFKNRAWVENEEQSSSSSEDEEGDNQDKEKDADDESSLEGLEKADDFEAKYNFRFEEAAADMKSGAELSNISYARGLTMTTLRRKDETRREKRLARQERKEQERKAKEEELRRLKNAKRQELNEKIKQIKSVIGELGDDSAVDEETLLKLVEGDFDPDKFEALMKETYDDDFYMKQDKEWKSDQDVKASLKNDEDGALLVGDDDNEGDLYDDSQKPEDEDDGEDQEKEGDAAEDEEDDGWMEEDEGYADGDEPEEETELERKIKSKMQEELYKFDYEDIVAGIPTRFKYRSVKPNNYGLTTEEILFARDATLKQYVSLKKMAPYREDDEYFVGSKKRRRFRDLLKHDLEEQIEEKPEKEVMKKDHGETQTDETADSGKKKKRRRKRGHKSSSDVANSGEQADSLEVGETADQAEVGEPKTKRSRPNKNSRPEMAAQDSLQSAKEGENLNKMEIAGKGDSKAKRSRRKKKRTEQKSSDDKTKTPMEARGNTDEGAEIVKPREQNLPDKKSSVSNEKSEKKRKQKEKKKAKSLEGVSKARLASYGL